MGAQEIGGQQERDEGNFQGDDASRSQGDSLRQALRSPRRFWGQEERYRISCVGHGTGIHGLSGVCAQSMFGPFTVLSLSVHSPVAVLWPHDISLTLSTWQLSSRLPGSADGWHL